MSITLKNLPTVQCLPTHSQASQEFVAQRLCLSNGTQTTSGNFLGIQLRGECLIKHTVCFHCKTTGYGQNGSKANPQHWTGMVLLMQIHEIAVQSHFLHPALRQKHVGNLNTIIRNFNISWIPFQKKKNSPLMPKPFSDKCLCVFIWEELPALGDWIRSTERGPEPVTTGTRPSTAPSRHHIITEGKTSVAAFI